MLLDIIGLLLAAGTTPSDRNSPFSDCSGCYISKDIPIWQKSQTAGTAWLFHGKLELLWYRSSMKCKHKPTQELKAEQ